VPPDRLRLRDLRTGGGDPSPVDWIPRLQDEEVDEVPAHHLYQGDHASIARSLPACVADPDRPVEVFISSAGYGLVGLETLLKPYSATFRAGHPDAVHAGSDPSSARRDWWAALSGWRQETHAQGSLLALVDQEHFDGHLIIACSAPYLDAMADDLDRARSRMTVDPLIITSGAAPLGFADCTLIVDASLQQELGGPLLSLQARVLRYLLLTLQEHELDLTECRRVLATKSRPRPPFRQRERMSDEALRAVIRNQLAVHAGDSANKMLRRLRDAGFACEQGRFARLFREVSR
jgi:hypothetical protein